MKDLRVGFPQPCIENWDKMQPIGCNRLCARCDTVIHNLSDMTVDDAEALFRSGGEVCVRARVDRAGVIQLRSAEKSARRRMIATSVGLVAFATQATAATTGSGIILGNLTGYDRPTSVVAIGPTGKKYRAKMQPLRQGVGDYQIKGLPPGVYKLRFVLKCNPREKYEWDGPTVDVADGPVWAQQADNRDNRDVGCAIIVGKIVTDERIA